MPESDAEVRGKGTVRVRGLSRWELLAGKGIEDRTAYEAYIVATGMVAPAMTPAAVEAWMRKALATDFEDVTDKITGLSGMDEGAERAAARELFEDPDAEFRDVPSGSVADDPGRAPEDAAS